MDNEKTLAEEAAEDLEGMKELENEEAETAEETEEETAEETAEEIEEAEETAEEQPRSIDGLYDAIDDLATKIWSRFDQIAAAIIDAGAVVNDAVDVVYDKADEVDDLMLEDLDYSL